MRFRKLSVAGFVGAAVIAVSPVGAQDEAPVLSAMMHDVSGNSVGIATIIVGPNGVLVRAELTGLEVGVHGFNFHKKGLCEAPPRERPEDPRPFQTAGGHIDPTDTRHGFLNADGPHLGDMPNVTVSESGTAAVEFFVPGLNLEMLLDADGSTIVVREGPDDYRSGGSGGRVACGLIESPN